MAETITKTYELITAIPTDEDMQAALEEHSTMFAENKDNQTNTGRKLAAVAYANMNQLLDRELSPNAIGEAYQSLGW